MLLEIDEWKAGAIVALMCVFYTAGYFAARYQFIEGRRVAIEAAIAAEKERRAEDDRRAKRAEDERNERERVRRVEIEHRRLAEIERLRLEREQVEKRQEELRAESQFEEEVQIYWGKYKEFLSSLMARYGARPDFSKIENDVIKQIRSTLRQCKQARQQLFFNTTKDAFDCE